MRAKLMFHSSRKSTSMEDDDEGDEEDNKDVLDENNYEDVTVGL